MIFERPIPNLLCVFLLCVCGAAYGQQPALTLKSSRALLRLVGFFYETASGRTVLPSFKAPTIRNKSGLFIRAGSGMELGDLNVEWNESRAIAERKPDLKALDEELKLWFAKRSVTPDR